MSKEDLHRTNTQLTNELKRLREQMVEMEREKQAVVEECRSMEVRLHEWTEHVWPPAVFGAALTLACCCAVWGEASQGDDGGGQHPGVRLQLPAAVAPKQDPGCWGTMRLSWAHLCHQRRLITQNMHLQNSNRWVWPKVEQRSIMENEQILDVVIVYKGVDSSCY